jgi:hypothetical protein
LTAAHPKACLHLSTRRLRNLHRAGCSWLRRRLDGHALAGSDPRVRPYLRRRGITACIARIGIESGERLGQHRWVVERANS